MSEGGRQDVSGDELRLLADKADEAAHNVAELRQRVQGIMDGLDRRGWNSGPVDSQWARTRFRLATLSDHLAQHHTELDRRGVEADVLNTPMPTETAVPVVAVISTPGPTPQAVRAPAAIPSGTPGPTPEPLPQLDVGDYARSKAAGWSWTLIKRQITTRIQPEYVTRITLSAGELVERTTVFISGSEQTASYVMRQTVTPMLNVVAKTELVNAGTVAAKDFIASPLKGVPLVSGAFQGATDWVTQPNLRPEQRAGRIVVAAGISIVVAVGVAAILPETAVGAVVAIGGGLIINAVVDRFAKPVIFTQFGLDADPEPQP